MAQCCCSWPPELAAVLGDLEYCRRASTAHVAHADFKVLQDLKVCKETL